MKIRGIEMSMIAEILCNMAFEIYVYICLYCILYVQFYFFFGLL